jgi:S1-C subfamily serine protease
MRKKLGVLILLLLVTVRVGMTGQQKSASGAIPNATQGARKKEPTSKEQAGATMDLVQMARQLRGVIVQVEVPMANGGTTIGSGFWVTDKGYVATCWHVVRDNPDATFKVKSGIDPLFDLKNNIMIFANWESFSGKLVGRDEVNDIALLKVDRNPFQQPAFTQPQIGTALRAHFKQAALDPRLPKAGQNVLLAGYPLGRPYPVVQEGSVASVAHSLPEFGPTKDSSLDRRQPR